MTDPTFATVSRVVAGFNFKKVHAMMVAVDWKWSMDSSANGLLVPTIEELKSQAERLLYAAVSNRYCVSSGGFKACYSVKHERASLSLTFEAAAYWSDYGA